MADAEYPHEYLPAPLIERSMQNGDTNAISQMVSGRRKTRLRFDTVPADTTLTWLFKTRQQAVLFGSWYRGPLNNGNRWFLINLDLPEGRGPWRCRMPEGYSGPARVGANLWRVSARVELYERPNIDGDWAEFYPEAIIFADVIDYAVNDEWPLSEYQIDMSVFDFAVNDEWPAP